MYKVQELSYRKHIVRKLCTQYVKGINSNPVTLKFRLRVTQGDWNWCHLKAWVQLPIRLSNYGAILYRLGDIATYWSKITKFLFLTLYLMPSQWVTPSEISEDVW